MSEMPQMSFSTFKVFITHLKVFQNDGQKSKDCFRCYENVFDKFPGT